MSPAKTITMLLNGAEIRAREGENLVDVCEANGVDVPHFCYHPGLKVEGNCRMCMVEIEGMPKLQVACNMPAREGLKVHTNTEKVKEAQRSVLELLLINHPIDCPICDQAGECYLQDYYMIHGKYRSRLEDDKVHKQKAIDLGPLVVLDSERCVLCSRCVRFCRDVAGAEELYIKNRGDHSEITTFPGRVLENPYSGNVVDICPVGALTSKDFRFKCRVWYLKTTPSVCPGCARGCNTHVDHNANIIQRLRPRENPEVNQWWLCDTGRLSHHEVHAGRLLGGWVRGRGETGAWAALDEIAGVLGRAAPSEIGFVASPDLPLEAQFAVKRFASRFPGARVAGGSLRAPWIDDGILRKADRHPNSRGLDLLGLAGGLDGLLLSPPKTLVVFEEDLIGDGGERARAALARVESLLVLGARRTPTVEAARAALAVSSYAEVDGTFVNFEGRIQRFERALIPLGESRPLPAILADLPGRQGNAIGRTPAGAEAAALWRDLAGEAPALEGVRFAEIPAEGLVLAAGREAIGSAGAAGAPRAAGGQA